MLTPRVTQILLVNKSTTFATGIAKFVQGNFAVRKYCKLTTPGSESDPPDLLAQQLDRCDAVPRVLDIVDRHFGVMNDSHVFNALSLIFKYRSQATVALLTDDRFKVLCRLVRKKAKFFSPNELVSALKCCSALGLNSSSFTVQTLLHLIRHSINDLDIEELMFLGFLVQRQKSDAIIKAFHIAVPLAVQIKAEPNVPVYSFREIAELLIFCSNFKNTVSPRFVDVLVHHFSQCFDKDIQEHLSPPRCVTLIISLSKLSVDEPILTNNLLNYLAKNTSEVTKQSLMAFVSGCRSSQWYNSVLYDNLIVRLLEQDVNSRQLLAVASLCLRNKHFSQLLCDSVAERVRTDPNLFVDPHISVLTIAELFARAGYKPPFWDIVARQLLNVKQQITTFETSAPRLLLRLVKALALLEIFPSNLLMRVLEDDLVDALYSTGNRAKFERDIENLLLVNQSLSTECSNYEGKRLSESSMLRIFDHYIRVQKKQMEYPLKTAVETSFEGSEYVKTGVFTRLGHHIDHLIAVDQYNRPVSTSPDSSHNDEHHSHPQQVRSGEEATLYAEDIAASLDCVKIALIILYPHHFCANTPRMTGVTQMRLRHLKFLGYVVVTINYENWEQLLDHEKLSFISREVHHALSRDCADTSSETT